MKMKRVPIVQHMPDGEARFVGWATMSVEGKNMAIMAELNADYAEQIFGDQTVSLSFAQTPVNA